MSAVLEKKAEEIIAYEGRFEILGGAWDMHGGRTMELRLIGAPDVHPFKRFKRNGPNGMGTRFLCELWDNPDADSISSNLEVMLCAWAESWNKGQWVKFRLDMEADRHPLEGLRARLQDEPGSIIYGVFFELQEDGTAVPQNKKRKMKPSQYAHLRCYKDGMFLQFLSETVRMKGELHEEWSGDDAKAYIRHKCQIESLGDLDRQPAARDRYRAVHDAYEKWRGRG